jgi:polysaccharide biosynthesis protein PslG
MLGVVVTPVIATPPNTMQRRLVRLVVALGLLWLALPAADAVAQRRHVPSGFLGVNVGGPMLDSGFASSGEFAVMARAGVESQRLPLYWAAMQPSQDGPIDFSVSDRLIGGAADHGVRSLPTVLLAPPWAARDPSNPASPPRDPATFGAFLTLLAQRYGPGGAFWRAHPRVAAVPVRAWQIWNEPAQGRYWSEQPFASGYVALLRAARTGLKAADPGAHIVLAALNSAANFTAWGSLEEIYRAGGRGLFDEAAVNPFTARPGNVVRTVELIRAVMARHGDSRLPVRLTEISWPSAAGHRLALSIGGIVVSERTQVQRVAAVMPLLAAARRRLRIASVYWYTWVSPPLGSTDPFDYAGLRRQSRGGVVSKPALASYRRAAQILEGCAKTSMATRCR